MSKIVCKFGGTSMATAENVSNVINIIKSDDARKYIVVSAPGKKFKEDEKITDILFECAVQVKLMGDCPIFDEVEKRFKTIVSDLKMDLDIVALLAETKHNIIEKNSVDYAASRGEYLSARVLASKIGYPFVDAENLVLFDNFGNFLPDETDKKCKEVLSKFQYAVIPGFYGKTTDGMIKTFSRGGSDISGAIVARGIKADLYENWTDVNGFMMASPEIVPDSKQIDFLSYKELRELSYMGASVLHAESVFPVWQCGIPTSIKNTFSPLSIGTMIMPEIKFATDDNLLTGVSGKKNFSMLTLQKDLMNNEKGFARKVLTILEDNNIKFEYMPTGIDTLSLVIESKYLTEKVKQKVVREINIAVSPDSVEISDNLAVIAVVGRNLNTQLNIASKIFLALDKSNIEVRLIDKGSSGHNIIVGVNNFDFEKAINSIYNELS